MYDYKMVMNHSSSTEVFRHKTYIVTVANSCYCVDQVVMMLKVIIVLTAIMYSTVNGSIRETTNKVGSINSRDERATGNPIVNT